METLLPIIAFCFVTTITPGPNNIMLMTSGSNHGIRQSIPHLLGIIVGFPLMVAVLGLGLGALFLNYPAVHLPIKLAGTTYLLYLAWKIANAGNPAADIDLKKPLTFLQAAVFQWVNPKAWVITIGGIAAFTSSGDVVAPVLTLVLAYHVVGGLCMASWLMFGVLIGRMLYNKRWLNAFNIAMAVLLVMSVVPMVLTDFDSLPVPGPAN